MAITLNAFRYIDDTWAPRDGVRGPYVLPRNKAQTRSAFKRLATRAIRRADAPEIETDAPIVVEDEARTFHGYIPTRDDLCERWCDHCRATYGATIVDLVFTGKASFSPTDDRDEGEIVCESVPTVEFLAMSQPYQDHADALDVLDADLHGVGWGTSFDPADVQWGFSVRKGVSTC